MVEQFAFLDLNTPDLVIILLIILLLFGGKNLPKLTKNLADSVRELRKGFNDDVSEPTPAPKAKNNSRNKKSA